MLSFISQLVSEPFVHEPFIRSPSLFTITDLVGTAIIGYAVYRLYRQRKTNGDGAVTSAQHERLSKRMVQFEHAQSEMSQRLDAIGHAATESEKRREENWIMLRDTSQAQLEAIKSLKGVVEKGNARVNYVAKTLEARPCVMNEANNGDEECPEENRP